MIGKTGIAFLLMVLSLPSLKGQEENIITLKERARNSRGMVQLESLLELGKAYYRRKTFDKAIDYGKVSLELSEKLGQEALTNPVASFTFNEVLRKKAESYMLLGNTYRAQGRAGKALRMYREAETIAKKIDDPTANEKAQAEIDSIKNNNRKLSIIENTGKAIKNAAESIADKVEISEEDKKSAANIRAMGRETAAKSARENGKIIKAIEQYEIAVDLYRQAGDTAKVREILTEIEKLYRVIGDQNQADKIAEISASASSGDSLPIFDAGGKSNPQDREELEEINKDIIQNIEKTKQQADSIEMEIQTHVKEGDVVAIRRSLSAFRENAKRYLEFKEDSMQIAMELDYIRQEKLILEEKAISAQAKMEKEKNFRNWLLFSLVMSLAFFIVVGRLFLQRRKDLNELKDAYQELDLTHKTLKTTQSQLVSSEKMASLGQLTAGIAHEINNPINFISGNITPLKNDINDLLIVLKKYEEAIQASNLTEQFAEVESLKLELEIDYITEEITELLNGIDEGVDRTTEIVKGLRNFARMDENDIKAFDIHNGIDSTLALLKSQVQSVEVIKDYNFEGEIEAFPGKLNQVFMNIMSNAIQAMPEGGMLYIGTKKSGDQVEIKFRDTGIGMDEETQKRIFEPFFTTKAVGEGTGLGMAITHGIIEEHKGSIEVNSTPGQGTEIVLRFPIEQPRQQSA